MRYEGEIGLLMQLEAVSEAAPEVAIAYIVINETAADQAAGRDVLHRFPTAQASLTIVACVARHLRHRVTELLPDY